MNRKQRRAAGMKFLTGKALKKFTKAARFNDHDHRGAVQVCLIRQATVFNTMLAGSTAPDLVALVRGIAEFLTQIDASAKGRGPLCLACETEFSANETPADFLLTVPMMADWSKTNAAMMLTGICARCCQHTDEQLLAVAMKLTRGLWPDAQVMHREEGTA
jgi:hypothetical protein